MDDDNFTILDRETLIPAGNSAERQRDRASGELKCIVRAITLAGDQGEPIVKIGPTGRLCVITVSQASSAPVVA